MKLITGINCRRNERES